MANGISNMVDGIVEAFVTVGIGALVLGLIFGLDVAGVSNSTLLTDIEGEVNDGMLAVAGIIVMVGVIYVLRLLRNR